MISPLTVQIHVLLLAKSVREVVPLKVNDSVKTTGVKGKVQEDDKSLLSLQE